MKNTIIGLAALVIGGTMLSMPVNNTALAQSHEPTPPQTVCGDREDVVRQLEEKYGEARNGIGLQPGRGVIEVYSSTETGSWTIIITNTQGISCLLAAGEAWMIEYPEPISDPL